MWDLLWDRDHLKEADKTFYLNPLNGVDYTPYMFRSTNLYPSDAMPAAPTPPTATKPFVAKAKFPYQGLSMLPC